MSEEQNSTRRSILGFSKETGKASGWKLSSRRIGKATKNSITIIVFLVIGAALGGISWIILPNTASPSVAGGMYITIPKQAVTITSLHVFAENINSEDANQVDEIVVKVKPVKLATVLRFTVNLPGYTWDTGTCRFDVDYAYALYQKYNSCSSSVDSILSGGINIRVQVDRIEGSSSDGASVAFQIGGRHLNFAENDSAATVILPRVIGLTKGARVQANYSFNGDVETFLWQGRVPDESSTYPEGGGDATWNLSSQEVTGPPVSASAINPSGQANDNRRLFIAGAMIGVAGAALLAAIQEALSKIRQGRSQAGEASSDTST